jgi:hypothetical protein
MVCIVCLNDLRLVYPRYHDLNGAKRRSGDEGEEVKDVESEFDAKSSRS